MVRIAVVGAGIVGLTTAVNIQETVPDARVTILSEKFGNDTTSSGAGGLYRPTGHLIKGVSVETIKKWVTDSWKYYTSLAMSPLAKESGQTLVPGYVVSDDKRFTENPLYKDIVFHFRYLTQEEMRSLNFNFKYGCFFTTIITQPKKFMPFLMTKFKGKGGKVQYRKVERIEELADEYDIVVNCSALGSEKIASDNTMYPVKGQLVHVKAPWVKNFVYCDSADPTYFIPHNDYLIVGGTRERGNYDLTVEPDVQRDILNKACKVLPQIKEAEIVDNWTGLRPSRDPLRLEKELLYVNGKRLRVVHNYGHGANGVSLSWGTAKEAAQLTKEWADQIPRTSKL